MDIIPNSYIQWDGIEELWPIDQNTEENKWQTQKRI